MDTKAKFSDCDAKMDLSTSDNTEYESDELFSDDEQKKEIQCRSEISQDVTVSRLFETPSMLLSSNSSCPVTHDATVPSTPLSLLPYLNKVNEQWTSDLETPQAQPHVASSTGATTQETPKLEQCTFEISSTEIDVDEIASASPVIVSKAVRRRPKRRIFRTSLSVDPQAVTNSDDVTININVEIPLTSESSVCGIQHDATNVATVLPDGNDFKDCESDILNKTQDKCNNKESENPVNISNSSTQEFFKNASFSKLERDELCSDNFDKQTVTEYTGQYNQRDAIENIDRDDNGAQENIDFTSARGTSFKISKQAALKAKRLFADVFDTDEVQNYESLAKKSFIERRDEHSSSCSLAESPPINDTKEEVVAKPKPQSTEQVDQLEIETRHNRKLPNTQCDFQTARGASVTISESSLSKAKALFAEQLNDISEDTFEEKLPEERALSAERLNDRFKNREIKPLIIQCGFQTARGASVTISESSLSKAKALFAEQLKDISENDTSENTFEEKLPEERAKALFAEQLNDISEDTFEEKLPEERALSAEQLNEQFKNSREIKPPVIQCGFQTARGASVTISESSLSKAKALFAEQLNDISENDTFEDTSEQKLPEERTEFAARLNDQFKNREIKPPIIQCGFQTARGTSVTISESSFSKAKALFAEQLNDISENDTFGDTSEQKLPEERAVFAERLNDQFKNKREIKPPIIQGGFQTARGASVKISQSALSKARAFFGDDLSDMSEPIRPEEKDSDFRSTNAVSNYSVQTLLKPKISFTKRLTSPLESIVAKRNNVSGKVESRRDTKLPSVGRDIQTARRGTSVRIPRRVLYRPKFLSAHRLDFSPEVSVQENAANVCGGDTKRRDLTTSGIQQTTTLQQAINAPPKERARSDDFPDESSPDLMHASWLQKRKSSGTSSDEYTPLGRNREFKRHESSKKPRVSNELQARKLFPDDVDAGNNENQDENKQTSFLARSDLESPKRDTAEPSESEAAGSPVIGTVFRKRRSFGHRREKKSRSQECTNEAPRENASRGKIDENEPQADGSRNSAPERNAESGDTKSSVCGDTQLMMNFVDRSVKILRDRLAATLEQENAITAKRRHGCERSVGHLYRCKEANVSARVPLKEIGAPPVPLTYRELIERRVQPNILTVTSATAASYKFQCSDFYGSDLARSNVRGIEMEDGARLIMDENGYVGVLEFQRSFLASTGVDPNLVPARWVGNHYRWIVWKLASMDRMRFGSAVLPRSLTPSRVMAQLRYRYDREIDRSQRSALRRILEKDDVASKRMILCVSSVTENNSVSPAAAETSPRKGVAVPKWKIELTDGWYSVPACVDIGMVKYLSNGKVKEGTKLAMSGAELLNRDRGCYPLEVTADVCGLRLHTNSTRRARWHAKLGYTPRSGPIPIELRNVCPNGGLIGRMTVVVARVYPMLYHERTASGDSVVRNAKCEEKAQSKYEQRCWSDIEAFYAKAEEDFQRKALPGETDDGMTIQLNEDYENLSSEDFVSEERQNELMQELRQKEERFKQQLQSKLRQSLPGPRQVSPLLKVRVCDGNTNAILSIWLPGEEIVDIVKEGACVSLRNVVASGKRGSELQLTAGRCAIFKPDRRRDVSHPVRAYTPLREITSTEFAPPYGEFDTVGFVCSVGPAPYGMKDFEVAHLAYPNAPANSHDTSYLSILFWQGIASYGYTEILTAGSIVACANLEWRRASSWNIPAAYCTERSTFTRNPRRNHLHEPFEILRGLITDPIEYAKECTSELNVELQKKATPTRYASNKNTPIKTCNSATSVDRNLADSTSAPKLGLKVTSNHVPSTSSIQKRLEKLQWYGEAPKLSPLVIRNSRRTSLQFRSPVCVSGENSTEDASRADQAGDSNTPQ